MASVTNSSAIVKERFTAASMKLKEDEDQWEESVCASTKANEEEDSSSTEGDVDTVCDEETIRAPVPEEATISIAEEEAKRDATLKSIGHPGLVTAVACVLKSISSIRRSGPQKPTIFHATRAPAISVEDYLDRLFKYYHCSESCMVLCLIYIDRILKKDVTFSVSVLNVHRLLATSLLLAAKFHDDTFYANTYYGKVAGIRVQELNRLEEAFLGMLNWKLTATPQEFDIYVERAFLPLAQARKRPQAPQQGSQTPKPQPEK